MYFYIYFPVCVSQDFSQIYWYCSCSALAHMMQCDTNEYARSMAQWFYSPAESALGGWSWGNFLSSWWTGLVCPLSPLLRGFGLLCRVPLDSAWWASKGPLIPWKQEQMNDPPVILPLCFSPGNAEGKCSAQAARKILAGWVHSTSLLRIMCLTLTLFFFPLLQPFTFSAYFDGLWMCHVAMDVNCN